MVRKAMMTAGAAAMFLAGCAAGVKSTEQSLVEAGFKKVVADTPQRKANLAKLTPRKLVSHQRGGQTIWTYADPAGCNCVFIGDAQAIQNYNNILLHDEGLASTDRTQMDWGEWGTY